MNMEEIQNVARDMFKEQDDLNVLLEENEDLLESIREHRVSISEKRREILQFMEEQNIEQMNIDDRVINLNKKNKIEHDMDQLKQLFTNKEEEFANYLSNVSSTSHRIVVKKPKHK